VAKLERFKPLRWKLPLPRASTSIRRTIEARKDRVGVALFRAYSQRAPEGIFRLCE